MERVVSAALVLAADPDLDNKEDEGLPPDREARVRKTYERAQKRLRVPPGAPRRGKSSLFYVKIAELYRDLQRRGEPFPAKEIARLKGVEANTVHQWLLRAREQGHLDWSPRAKRRPTAAG